MLITIDQPEGPRHGAEPAGGIRDDLALVRSLLVTLASERIVGHQRVTLTIDLEGANPGKLVGIAKSLKGFDLEKNTSATRTAGTGAVIHAFPDKAGQRSGAS